jgi:hypothetical protein
MVRIRKYQLAVIVLVLLSMLVSCFKADEANDFRVPSSFKILTVPTPYTIYSYDSYIDLDSAKIVETVPQSAWDLAFECSPQGWHILVNSSASREIAVTVYTDFTKDYSSYSTNDWSFDASSGNLDSTAVGNWLTNGQASKQIYLLGLNEGNGTYKVLQKIIFIGVSDSIFTFISTDPQKVIPDTIKIRKDPAYRYVYYSFASPNKTLKLEPARNNWDIKMSTYRTTLYTDAGQPVPYLVRGVLSNTPGVQVLKVFDSNFWEASLSQYSGQVFSDKQDALGWDWKDLNSRDNALYRIVPDVYYIIRTKSGNYLKLKFLSYVNDKAENGYPKIIFGKL